MLGHGQVRTYPLASVVGCDGGDVAQRLIIEGHAVEGHEATLDHVWIKPDRKMRKRLGRKPRVPSFREFA